MKAVILSAGIGSRLDSFTRNKPKCLVRVSGKPILEYQIESYLAAGLEQGDIYIAAGHKYSMLESYLNQKFPAVNLINNPEYDITNNMFSLYMTLNAIEFAPGETLFISNGDCVYDSGIIVGMSKSDCQDTVAADKDRYIRESMKITVSENIIRNISKEIPDSEAYGVSIDLYSISPGPRIALMKIMADYIETRKDRNLWTEVALRDLFMTHDFRPFDIKGKRWVEIDNLDDLLQADRIFSEFDPDRKKCFVVDMDGTVYLGKKPITGTIDFIKRNRHKRDFYFLTNNTSKIPTDYVRRLTELGIEVDPRQILAPHIPLIDFLREEKIKFVYPVANGKYREFLSSEMPELEFTDDAALCQSIVLTYDTEINYSKLSTAALLLKSPEIRYLATHGDKVCPTEKGSIPDIGSYISLFETSTGRRPEMIFGKPNGELLNSIFKIHDRDEIVMAGDRLYTDKALAHNAGIDFILVLSGETTREDVEDCLEFPSLIVDDLGDLLQ